MGRGAHSLALAGVAWQVFKPHQPQISHTDSVEFHPSQIPVLNSGIRGGGMVARGGNNFQGKCMSSWISSRGNLLTLSYREAAHPSTRPTPDSIASRKQTSWMRCTLGIVVPPVWHPFLRLKFPNHIADRRHNSFPTLPSHRESKRLHAKVPLG